MKKLTVLAALLLAVSAGTTVFAQTEYDPQEKSVKNTAQGGYQTVLITEGDGAAVTDEKIVYVDQAATTFQAATGFLLKNNSSDGAGVADGVYTIRFGSKDGRTTTTKFAVGVGIEGYDTKLDVKGEPVQAANGKYSHGFVTPDCGVDFSNGGIILVKINDSVMAYPANNGLTLTGNVKAMFGVQIDEVEAGKAIEVYFRPGADVSTSAN